MKQSPRHITHGWTIIELLIVISIVGILASVAIPKYLDLRQNARIAAIQSAAGSMHSAAMLFHSACVVSPSCNVQSGPAGGNGLGNSISVQGQSITLAYGYPRGTTAGIIRAASLDTSNFEIVAGPTGTVQVRAPEARLSGDCEAEYKQPSAAGAAYTIIVTTSGC